MSRTALPARREALTVDLRHHGERFHATLGRGDDGRLAEIFVCGPRAGSDLAAIAHDAAIVLSIAMQHGVPAAAFAPAVSRDGDARPASIVGALADLLMREDS